MPWKKVSTYDPNQEKRSKNFRTDYQITLPHTHTDSCSSLAICSNKSKCLLFMHDIKGKKQVSESYNLVPNRAKILTTSLSLRAKEKWKKNFSLMNICAFKRKKRLKYWCQEAMNSFHSPKKWKNSIKRFNELFKPNWKPVCSEYPDRKLGSSAFQGKWSRLSLHHSHRPYFFLLKSTFN